MRLRGLPAPVRDEPGGLRIRFAFQLLFGALNNAVINNPGPLGLEDAAMETELARAVCAYLRAAWLPAWRCLWPAPGYASAPVAAAASAPAASSQARELPMASSPARRADT